MKMKWYDMTDEMVRVNVRQIMLNESTFALMAKIKFITYLNWFAATKLTYLIRYPAKWNEM